MLAQLMKKLGYQFRDPELLRQALTRQSAIEEKVASAAAQNYQTLELLGDAILKATLTALLLQETTNMTEGQLHDTLQPLITNDGVMIQIAEQLEIDRFLIRGRGETTITDKMRVDAVEAILGAINLDSIRNSKSQKSILTVVERLWEPYLTAPTASASAAAAPATSAQLHDAVCANDLPAVRRLVAPGIINGRDNFGRTAIFMAAERGYEPIFDYLQQQGADIEVADNGRWKPLHFAIYRQQENIVRKLLRLNPDVTSRCDNGTPLEVAEDRKNKTIIAMLEQHIKRTSAQSASASASAPAGSDKSATSLARSLQTLFTTGKAKKTPIATFETRVKAVGSEHINDPNPAGGRGDTPLMSLLRKQKFSEPEVQRAKLLVRYGASWTVANTKGETAQQLLQAKHPEMAATFGK